VNIGETACVCVEADKPWNDSGIDVAANESYNLVVPQSERWIDWHIPYSADGYTSTPLIRPWESLRRVPDQNWFKLIGTLGKSTKPPVIVGSQLIGFSPAFAGRLYFFANDLLWMYWNNKGAIALGVTRIE
jgi:hypothetical protein